MSDEKVKKDIEETAIRIIRNLALYHGADPVKTVEGEKTLFWDICTALKAERRKVLNDLRVKKLEERIRETLCLCNPPTEYICLRCETLANFQELLKENE